MKLKAFELERLRVLHEASAGAAREAELQVQLLQRKCRALETQYYALEAEAARRSADLEGASAADRAKLQHYELLERELDEEILQQAGKGAAPGSTEGALSVVPNVPAVRPRPPTQGARKDRTLLRQRACT